MELSKTIISDLELNYSKGDRLCVTDKLFQVFEGNVVGINKELGRLLLTDIVQLPSNVSIKEPRSFDRCDIIQVKQCNKNLTEDKSQGAELPKKVAQISKELYNEIKKLQNEYIYITVLGSDFNRAISLLKQSDIIGIMMEDTSKGRAERASVLAVSTNSNVFVFDLLTLGIEAFDKGLKQILESQNIIKVVYDCRLMSDCLKFKYLTDIKNVRDVEAEDIIIVEQERRMIRKHNRSLHHLIKVYLNIDIETFQILYDEWFERPLPKKLLNVLVCLVSFLIPTQNAIETKYYQRLIDVSELYNKSVRNCEFYEYVQFDTRYTLREEIIELIKPHDTPRKSYKPLKISQENKN